MDFEKLKDFLFFTPTVQSIAAVVIGTIVVVILARCMSRRRRRRRGQPRPRPRSHASPSAKVGGGGGGGDYDDDDDDSVVNARYVRVWTNKTPLVLGEVEVFSGTQNLAPVYGRASQSSTYNNDPDHYGASFAVNGSLSATGFGGGDEARTKDNESIAWWELDLGSEYPVNQVNLWPQDRGRFPHPFSKWYIDGDMGLRVELLCKRRRVKWSRKVHQWKDVITLPIK